MDTHNAKKNLDPDVVRHWDRLRENVNFQTFITTHICRKGVTWLNFVSLRPCYQGETSSRKA